jgi:2-methylcitrate dehydratase PrpD
MLGDELKRSPKSDLRAVREAFAARAAVEAVLLARAGVEAVEAPLEGPSGLFAMLSGKPPKAQAFATIGAVFFGPDVGVKRWPSCRGTHSAVLAAQAFRGKGIAGPDIAAVSVQVGPPNDMLFVPRAQRIAPQTAIDGKFSIPFVFASVMEAGDLSLSSFAPGQLRAPEILALAERVTMSAEPVPKGVEAIYVIETCNGEVLSEVIDAVPVWRARDISLPDLIPKLQACFGFGTRSPDVSAFLAAIARLESQSIGLLMRML